MTLWSDALWAAIQDEGIKGFADPIPVEEIAFDHETTVAPGAPPIAWRDFEETSGSVYRIKVWPLCQAGLGVDLVDRDEHHRMTVPVRRMSQEQFDTTGSDGEILFQVPHNDASSLPKIFGYTSSH